MRYKIFLEWDGFGLSGWQKQENSILKKSILTVQQILEICILRLTQEKVIVEGAGRTDAGVHAINYVAHFDLSKFWDESVILKGLNYYLRNYFYDIKLDQKIVVLFVELAEDNFHARFSAKSRCYEYRILNRKSPSAFKSNKVWHVSQDLDINLMIEASKVMIGNHDFSAFRSSSCQSKTAIKTLDSIEIKKVNDEIITEVIARSFLHNQVRIISGTLKMVGERKMNIDMVREAIKTGDRSKAGVTAPPYGLYFKKVIY